MLTQDISPTTPTDTLRLSLIESPTDKSTNSTNTDNNDLSDDDNDDDCSPRQAMLPMLQQDTPRWKQEQEHLHKSTHASFHDGIPILVWDGTQYQLDCNHNHRPISVWGGTTHTNIMYDDDDDDDTNDAYDYDNYGTVYDYAYGDSFNMNDPSVRSQFQKCSQIQDHNDAMKKYTQAMTQATPQATPQTTLQAILQATPQASSQQKQPHKHATMKHTTMKHTQEEPTPYTYDTLQLLFLTTHYETTTTNDCINEFPLYTVPQYITRK